MQQRGLTAPSKIKENGDFNPGVGGPIKRDKLWFFPPVSTSSPDNLVAGHVLQRQREQPDESATCSTGEQAILHQDQQISQLAT